MPSFTAQIQRTVTHFTNITIEAEDEDDANSQADNLVNDYSALDAAMKLEKAEWDLDDETYEVLEVNEE